MAVYVCFMALLCLLIKSDGELGFQNARSVTTASAVALAEAEPIKHTVRVMRSIYLLIVK
jgi:hypothetical protein